MNLRMVQAALVIALGFLVVGLSTATALLFIGFHEQGGTLRSQVVQIQRVTDANARLVKSIQQERERNIRDNCRETNDRHDRTVARLDARLDAALRAATPQRAAQIQESRDFTVALIDALAPVRNCDALVRAQVQAP